MFICPLIHGVIEAFFIDNKDNPIFYCNNCPDCTCMIFDDDYKMYNCNIVYGCNDCQWYICSVRKYDLAEESIYTLGRSEKIKTKVVNLDSNKDSRCWFAGIEYAYGWFDYIHECTPDESGLYFYLFEEKSRLKHVETIIKFHDWAWF